MEKERERGGTVPVGCVSWMRRVAPRRGINVMGREARELSVVACVHTRFEKQNLFSDLVFKCGGLGLNLGGFVGSPYIYLGGGTLGSHPAPVFPASTTPTF